MTRRLLLALVLAIVSTASAAPLQPHKRAEFVATMSASCIKKQTADPVNRNIPMGVITDFCNCYANETANRLTQEVADYMESSGDLKPVVNATAVAANICTARVFG